VGTHCKHAQKYGVKHTDTDMATVMFFDFVLKKLNAVGTVLVELMRRN
jgi:hypothetical protein